MEKETKKKIDKKKIIKTILIVLLFMTIYILFGLIFVCYNSITNNNASKLDNTKEINKNEDLDYSEINKTIIDTPNLLNNDKNYNITTIYDKNNNIISDATIDINIIDSKYIKLNTIYYTKGNYNPYIKINLNELVYLNSEHYNSRYNPNDFYLSMIEINSPFGPIWNDYDLDYVSVLDNIKVVNTNKYNNNFDITSSNGYDYTISINSNFYDNNFNYGHLDNLDLINNNYDLWISINDDWWPDNDIDGSFIIYNMSLIQSQWWEELEYQNKIYNPWYFYSFNSTILNNENKEILNNQYDSIWADYQRLYQDNERLQEQYNQLQQDYEDNVYIYNPFYNATLKYYYSLSATNPAYTKTITNDYLDNKMFINPRNIILEGEDTNEKYTFDNEQNIGYFELELYKSMPITNLNFTYLTNKANDFNFNITFYFNDGTDWSYTNPQTTEFYKNFIVNMENTNFDFSNKQVVKMTWRRQYSYIINTITTDSYYNGFVNGQEYGSKNGYNKGLEEGHEQGFNEGIEFEKSIVDTESQSYIYAQNKGYQEGAQEDFSSNAFLLLIEGIFSYPIQLIANFFNFEFMGINLLAVITFIITIGIVVFVIKKFK